MTRLKRAFTLILTVLFTGIFLMGCALFATDANVQANLVVARFNTSNGPVEITRRQLEIAFGAFGWQFMQQGMSQRDAVQQTLDVLIDREIFAYLAVHGGNTWTATIDGEDVEQFEYWFGSFGHGHQGSGAGWTRALTAHEAARTRRNTFMAMEAQINASVRQLREDGGMFVPEEPDPEPEGSPIFEPHNQHITTRGSGANRTFELNLDRFNDLEEINLFMTEPPAGMNHIQNWLFDGDRAAATAAGYLVGPFRPRNDTVVERNLMRDARNRMVRHLRNAERGLRFADTSDNGVIIREVERVLLSEEQTVLANRFRDTHEQGIMTAGRSYFDLFQNRFDPIRTVDGVRIDPMQEWQDAVHARNAETVQRTVESASANFENEIVFAIDRFQKGVDTRDSISASILQDNAASLRWAPRDVANNFFTVSHVLLSFTDEQRAEIETELPQRLRRGEITVEQFDAEVQRIRAELVAPERDHTTGLETGRMFTADEVLGLVQDAVHGSHNPQLAFRDMIYRFNTDPGMQNAEFEYVVGVDLRDIDPDTGERIGEETMSRMVVPFTDASRELHATGRRGEMSGLVWTDFGVHIIMYTRNLTDFIFTNSLARLSTELDFFLHQTQTSYGNRTFFDTAVDAVIGGEFNRAEQAIIGTFKHNPAHRVTIYRDRFRSMWD